MELSHVFKPRAVRYKLIQLYFLETAGKPGLIFNKADIHKSKKEETNWELISWIAGKQIPEFRFKA